MRKFLLGLCLLIVLGAAVFWWVTRPERVGGAVAGLSGDASAGEAVFWAGGCANCHAAPEAKDDARLVLAGGQGFATQFGTFYAPNISPSEAGIGGWSLEDLADAVMAGVSPGGQHYYPAFPYVAYAHAAPQDIADLKAFLDTLPASDAPSRDHEVGFPFSIRRMLGGWKFLFADDAWVLDGELSDQLARGRYLVEALGHCGECHTPRNALGGLERDRWLSGAENPSGQGRIPNITPAALDWSEAEIAEYLNSGFTPEFDSAGGEMVAVIESIAHLPDADRQAIAAYLKQVPAVE